MTLNTGIPVSDPYAQPHRVGAALVVLGDDTGEGPRDPQHVLNPPEYGPGFHHYFPTYPLTGPSNVITKAAGTLGDDFTPETLPQNVFQIVCYKTELDHWFPKLAQSVPDWAPYDSSPIWDPSSPYAGNEPLLQSEYILNFASDQFATFYNETGVENLIDNPERAPENLRTLFPRWTDETAYEMQVYPYEDAIQIETGPGVYYWQTRDEANQPKDFISPWYVDWDGDFMQGRTRSFYDFSFSFGNLDPYRQRGSPGYGYGEYCTNIPDVASWQYDPTYAFYDSGVPYLTGANRSFLANTFLPINPASPDVIETIRYQAKATHGLFLNAKGCCWNLGTVVTLDVHIWKAPPKKVLWSKSGGNFYYNFKFGPAGQPDPTVKPYPYWDDTAPTDVLPGPCVGHPGNRHDPGHPGLDYIETGETQSPYTGLIAPGPVTLHYWGHCWGVDYDAPTCEEVDVVTIEVTITEENAPPVIDPDSPPPDLTQWGIKVSDIELPIIEGFFTYIKDYEVVSITKAGEP